MRPEKHLVFPAWCVGCGRYISRNERSSSSYLCRFCYDDLPFSEETTCSKCGLAHQAAFCDQTWAKDITGFYSIFTHDSPISGWISALKYSRYFTVGRCVRGFIRRWFEENKPIVSAIDYLVPVPIHPLRLRQRGFNQSSYLLNSQPYLAVQTSLIKKATWSAHQAGRSRRERVKRVRGRYRITRSVEKRSVLLFDDVCTTGRTIEEVSGALKRAGAADIHVLVLSRAM